MAKNRRKTVEQLANLEVVGMLLSAATSAANKTVNGQIVQTVGTLTELAEVQPRQVLEVIGFVDGCMELTKRMAAICEAERQEVQVNEDYDSSDDVPASEARAFTGTPEQKYMIKCRAFLAAVYNHLVGKTVPSPLKELISVPDLKDGGGQSKGYPPAGDRDDRRSPNQD